MIQTRGIKNQVAGSVIIICFIFSGLPSLAQKPSDKYSAIDWQLLDYTNDSVFGTSVNKAYMQLLAGKKSNPVIVAVIDAGLDTAHEDLLGHVWTNKGEIPGNGIDDDHNGYIDDVHGWNFIGGPDGKNITTESSEAYREYYRLRLVFNSSSDSGHSPADRAYWKTVKGVFIKDSLRAHQAVFAVGRLILQIKNTDSVLHLAMHRDSVSEKDIMSFQPVDSPAIAAKNASLMYYKRFGLDENSDMSSFFGEAEDYVKSNRDKLDNYTKDPNAARRQIVQDNPDDYNDKKYGNNNIAAGVPSHGTHVAGIIAATRNNNIGMNGIDDNVWIMPVRTIPDGDERDKDVALAIRYAVDNGAKIINMSFGKPFSPEKKWVDEAVKYAEQKDVLLVHAAGNDTKDIDTVASYPNPDYLNENREAANFITVGASTGGPDSLVVARFSNYGAREVDIFAPGQAVYSTIPGSKYQAYSGTSMASPVVAGVAALLLEYYPLLSAKQLKYILMQSAMKLPDPQVKSPVTGKMVDFSTLSRTGGIVNAYNALLLAATVKGERKRK